MDTTAAAQQAGVTVATIRAWCRRGAVAAAKQARRWVIDAASLARRITIGAARRARKATTMTIDLTATGTYQLVPGEPPVTITPTVKRRTPAHGGPITTIRGIAPLLADKLNAIRDHGDRMHAVNALRGATIVLADEYDADWDGEPGARDGGRLRTTYRGGSAVTVDDVLDLAERIRTHLATG